MKILVHVSMLAAACMASAALAALDINTAKQSELEAIRGLGPVKAKAIIDYRDRNGKFNTIEELDNVRGFGKASVEKLRSELIVAPAKPPQRR